MKYFPFHLKYITSTLFLLYANIPLNNIIIFHRTQYTYMSESIHSTFLIEVEAI